MPQIVWPDSIIANMVVSVQLHAVILIPKFDGNQWLYLRSQVKKAGLTAKTLDELDVARDITVRKRITKM